MIRDSSKLPRTWMLKELSQNCSHSWTCECKRSNSEESAKTERELTDRRGNMRFNWVVQGNKKSTRSEITNKNNIWAIN